MKTRKTIFYGLLAVILALTLALTLVACGDEEEDSKTPFPTDGTLDEKLTWVSSEDNVKDGETYTIEVTADETISGHDISPGAIHITIVLKGIGAERKISFSDGTYGAFLLSVGQYVTLVLDENITLQGRSDSTTSLVIVRGGRLEMKAGAKIIGNTNTAAYSGGGGVYVSNGGTFTMNGGTISGNTATGSLGGGGVYVAAGGTFTKTGGTIYGYSESDTVNSNVVKNSSGAVQNNKGHAVNAGSGKLRETTVGSSDNLDSTKTGAEGGWAAED